MNRKEEKETIKIIGKYMDQVAQSLLKSERVVAAKIFRKKPKRKEL